MKFAIRAISFSIVALVLFNAQAAKADTFTQCTAASCTFELTSAGTDGNITLYLTGTPLLNAKLKPTGAYGITATTGFVTISGDEIFKVTDIQNDPSGAGIAFTPTGGKTFNNKLWGPNMAEPWIGLDGLLLEIPDLVVSNKNGKSDLWLFRLVGTKYELLTDLKGSTIEYDLGTTGPTKTPLTVTNTPEPVTLLLFGSGLMGIGGLVRRRLIG